MFIARACPLFFCCKRFLFKFTVHDTRFQLRSSFFTRSGIRKIKVLKFYCTCCAIYQVCLSFLQLLFNHNWIPYFGFLTLICFISHSLQHDASPRLKARPLKILIYKIKMILTLSWLVATKFCLRIYHLLTLKLSVEVTSPPNKSNVKIMKFLKDLKSLTSQENIYDSIAFVSTLKSETCGFVTWDYNICLTITYKSSPMFIGLQKFAFHLTVLFPRFKTTPKILNVQFSVRNITENKKRYSNRK